MYVRAITIEGFATKIVQHVHEKCDIIVSTNSVRRALNDVRLYAQVKNKKLMLIQKHINAKFEFAKGYNDWTIYNWEHVIFFDDTKVNKIC